MAGDAVVETDAVVKRQLARRPHLAQRDLEAGGGFRADVRRRLLGEQGMRTLRRIEPREDRFDAAGREDALDLGIDGAERFRRNILRRIGRENGVHVAGRRQPLDDRVEVAGRRGMGRDAGMERIAAREPGRSERAIDADLVRQARERMADADIGEEADPRFRHGEDGVLRKDAMRTMHGDAGAAAHHIAMHQRDIGLRKMPDRGIETIFIAEEGGERRAVAADIISAAHIAAGAKGAAIAAHDHRGDGIVVERGGSVERHEADPATPLEKDLRICAHQVLPVQGRTILGRRAESARVDRQLVH